MDIPFATLHQKILAGKITLGFDATTGKAYYERNIRNEDDEITGVKRFYLPTKDEVISILAATGNERQGLIYVRDNYPQ